MKNHMEEVVRLSKCYMINSIEAPIRMKNAHGSGGKIVEMLYDQSIYASIRMKNPREVVLRLSKCYMINQYKPQ